MRNINEVLENGELVIVDISIRERNTTAWLKNLYRYRKFEDINPRVFTKVKSSILDEFQDYDLSKVMTVRGVVSEWIDYANAVRQKKLALERNARNNKKSIEHPVGLELERIHAGILAIVERAKDYVYPQNEPSYLTALEILRGLSYKVLSNKQHRRETDLHLAAAGISSAQETPTHIITKDGDIGKLLISYFHDYQVNYPLQCHYVTEGINLDPVFK